MPQFMKVRRQKKNEKKWSLEVQALLEFGRKKYVTLAILVFQVNPFELNVKCNIFV